MISHIITKIKTLNKKKICINKREVNKIDFGLLNQLSRYYEATDLSIDEVVWEDLDMQKVFVDMNNTTTSAGEEVLYHWLHNPMNDKEKLKDRENHLHDLGKDNQILDNIRVRLSQIGYITYDYREMINNGFKPNGVLLALFTLLSFLCFGSMLYSIITLSTVFIFIILTVFSVNVVIHYRYTKKIDSEIDTLSYVVRLLSRSRKIAILTKECYPELSIELESLFSKLKSIYVKSSIIFKVDGMNTLEDYLNILFLIKERNYLMVAKQVEMCKNEIIRLYEIIGELDALSSIIVYRSELEYYCIPQLDENNEELVVEEIYHPLVKHPVCNDVHTLHSMVITGSNMSGKSTFLRTIGINTIFAHSIVTCLAKAYSSRFLRVLTSINLSDNITASKSYFLMEAEVIKGMVDKANCNVHSLILIDEIFKGTNPTERIAAAIEILNLLAAGSTLTFVATHDLQILSHLQGFDCYYFAESVTDQGMAFEYKLNKGIVPTRNAIKILSYLKYPNSLLSKIELRLQNVDV